MCMHAWCSLIICFNLMDDERTPEEQAYFNLLAKYREEREEVEDEEARFQEDIEQALALSLSEVTSDPRAATQTVDTEENERKGPVGHSRRNRRFVSERSSDGDSQRAKHNSQMSSQEDNSHHHAVGRRRSVELAEEARRQLLEENADERHPSGRRRSIEMAEEMRRQMQSTEETNGHASGVHPPGRRRSVELAEEMQKQMLMDELRLGEKQQYHASGRRRSIEIAEEMQRMMLEDNQNGDSSEQVHPSRRRRSVEMAEAARRDILAGGNNLTDEEEVSREIEELIRRGLIPSDSPRHVRPRRTDSDDNLFGYGDLPATDRRVIGPRGSKARKPQHHRIDFKNPFEFDVDGFPVNWDKARIPNFGSKDLFNLVEIIPGEEEYETIARDFHIADLEVKKIERLQNPHFLERYKTERDQLLRRRGRDFDVNARYLYHGSAADKLILCEEGLDARLGMSGCFGKGIYFSDNPKKCVQYVSRSDVPYILMCRVMLGEAKIYTKGEMDRGLKREPEKESPNGVSKFYDSVRGRPVDYNEYVVYENRRAMIEYIITFHYQGMPERGATNASNQVGGAVAANAIEEESIEDHMKRIQQVREEIRQTRAAERGEKYTGPTQAQKKKDRDVWRRVLKVTCPPGTAGHENVKGIYEYLDKEENQDTGVTMTTTTDQAVGQAASDGNNNNADDDIDLATARSLVDVEEDDSVQLVMSHLVADFMGVTTTDNVQMAKMYLERAAMNLDRAILLYYEEEAS